MKQISEKISELSQRSKPGRSYGLELPLDI